MRRVPIATLKARLSEYVAAAKDGEEIVITDRGKPVARLMAVERQEGLEARVEELIRTGRAVRHGTGKIPNDFWDLPRPADPQGLVLKGLLRDREEDR